MTVVPITTTQTLATGSVEGFLTSAELDALAVAMDRYLGPAERASHGDARTTSVHEIPGRGTAEAMAVYEPAGRLEVTPIPPEADAVLADAIARAMPALAVPFPAVTACRPWVYVEYAAGQHVTAHLDGIAPEPGAWPRQVAGISVAIEAPDEGGEFYVETTAGDDLWRDIATGPAPGYAPGTRIARDGADLSSLWFAALPRTRWTVAAAPGTALVYGSQLAHGTVPVRRGRSRKFISWLIADNADRE